MLKALELAVEALEPAPEAEADVSAESPPAADPNGQCANRHTERGDSAESPEVPWQPVAVEDTPYPLWGRPQSAGAVKDDDRRVWSRL